MQIYTNFLKLPEAFLKGKLNKQKFPKKNQTFSGYYYRV